MTLGKTRPGTFSVLTILLDYLFPPVLRSRAAEVTEHLVPPLFARKQPKRLGTKTTPLVPLRSLPSAPIRERSRNVAPRLTNRPFATRQNPLPLTSPKSLPTTFLACVLWQRIGPLRSSFLLLTSLKLIFYALTLTSLTPLYPPVPTRFRPTLKNNSSIL